MSLEAGVRLRLGSLDLEASLAVEEGEVVALLGPNGAGKTTLLRVLAGLQPLAGGRVLLDGRVLEDAATGAYVPPERRPIGVVFQDYLLFPHLSALENVEFGLRSRGTPRAQAREEARRWLGEVGLGGHGGARPAHLSGGQRQRVALARALATSPRLLLLDEPMAALDASTRAQLRRDLRRLLAGFRGVRLLVTHDPLEAVTLGGRMVVLEAGRVVQAGSAREITERPRSRYVADLVGTNLLRGRVTGRDGLVELEAGGRLRALGAPSGEVFASVHPRAVALYRERPAGTPRNVWSGRPESMELLGDRVRVRVAGSPSIVAEVTPAAVQELRLGEGGEVWVSVKATEVEVYPA